MAIKKVNNWKKPSYYLGKLSLDPDPRGSSRYFDVKSYPSFEIAENLSSGVRIKTGCLLAKNNLYHGIKISLIIFKTLSKIMTKIIMKDMKVFLISFPIFLKSSLYLFIALF